MLFSDRFDAGKQLGQALHDYAGMASVVVVGIPRGGVEVAQVAAEELGASVGIVITRKIGFPGREEAAIGAVGPDGKAYVDDSWIDYAGISKEYVAEQVKLAKAEIKRRYKEYTGKAVPPSFRGKVVIVVDDGAATGQSIKAVVEHLRSQKPKRLVAALPVAPRDVVTALKELFDDVICLHTPLVFYAVGHFYNTFEQITDEQVKALLKRQKAEKGLAKKKKS